jgi:hypothetical protein
MKKFIELTESVTITNVYVNVEQIIKIYEIKKPSGSEFTRVQTTSGYHNEIEVIERAEQILNLINS